MNKLSSRFCQSVVGSGLFLILLAVTASAAVITVDTTSQDSIYSLCTAQPNDCSIRGAVFKAVSGDDIVFDPAVFNVPRVINLTGSEIFIDKNLRITGPGAKLLTLQVYRGHKIRLIRVADNTAAAISGMTIAGGYIVSNSAQQQKGGCVYNSGNLSLAEVVVKNCRIELTAFDYTRGVGIYNEGFLSVSGSTINNNEPTPETVYHYAQGGGIANSGYLSVSNSTITKNAATTGAAIYSEEGTVLLQNATVADNRAWFSGGSGGGLYLKHSALYLVDTLISGNEGFLSGYNGIVTSINSAVYSHGYNLVNYSACTACNWQATDLLDVDPLLDPQGLKDNGGPTPTIALQRGSPAIDFGNSTLPFDQRGFPRPVDTISSANGTGNLSDIGAYEKQ